VQLAAPYSPARMTAGNFASASVKKVVGWNRQVYQRLKLAFRLGLRRQIFIAVCDDLTRRDGIAAKLQSELSQESPRFSGYPQFVTLRLEDDTDANPIAQVQQWLAQNPPLDRRNDVRIPGFQILGVERLTRQPAPVQWAFLNHLRETPRNLSTLESSLLLWVSQPWLYSIEQSAPEFWRCCTGIFEFRGEPIAEEDRLWDEDELMPGSVPDVPIDIKVRSQIPESFPLTLESDPFGKYNPIDNGVGQTTGSSQPQQSAFGHVDRGLVAEVLASLDRVTSAPAKSLELLEQIEQLHRLQAPATLIAEHYQYLGDIYRDRIESGETAPAFIGIAIRAYQQAIDFWEEMPLVQETIQERVLSILNDLGTLYWILSHSATDLDLKSVNLEHSTRAYQAALKLIDPQSQTQSWCLIQNNLGGVYAELATCKDAADNWQQAAIAFEASLHGADLDSQQYAATQDRLGTAYWNLAQYRQPVKFLKQSIAAYQEALNWNHGDSDPLGYAAIQNNLGTAYWNLSAREEPKVYLRLAIEAYCQALRYRTPDVSPVGCAVTHNNLGTAFWQLADRSQDDASGYRVLLEGAISAYETAIDLARSLLENTDVPQDEIGLTFDRFATHNNLGLAHYQWVTHPHHRCDAATRRSHLETSLHHHLQALAGWKSDPQRYQMALEFVVQTTRAFYNDGDIQGQNLAFSRLPAELLPEVMQLF
jgi:tetratricopeptide (TPR) repeat protein